MTLDLELIHPRMRKLVAFLNDNHFVTTDSGDGVINVDLGMEEALDYPHVVMVVEESADLIKEADYLITLLKAHGVLLRQGDPEKWLEASYNPADGVAVLFLGGVSDEDLGEVHFSKAQT